LVSKLRWKNIKITVEEIGWEGKVGASDRLVNMVMNLGIP
jgi:hypothetical protein